MFGLMRAKNCGLSDEQKLRRRLNYCGTCKTVGAIYGQKARLLLNHDTVFLAEILNVLGGAESDDWQRAFRSYNCLSLPVGEIPPALEFAATANVVLADFKIRDHLTDESKTRWRVANKTFSKAFQKAAARLLESDFPISELSEILSEQPIRESDFKAKDSAEILAYLSAPTAAATELFFAHGAKIIGRNDERETMSALGAAFGRLIYLLDAFEDYEKDLRRNQFNAFGAAFSLSEAKLSGAARRKAVSVLRAAQSDVVKNLETLSIGDEAKRLFVSRLQNNLARKLKTDLPILAAVCRPKKRLTAAERWRKAKERARELTAKPKAAHSRWKTIELSAAFAVVAFVAFVAPHEARQAKSWQDCAGLGFNLMFLGSIAGAAIAVLPLKMSADIPPPSPHEVPEIADRAARKAARKAKRQQARNNGGENDGWCCGFCDFCDCCSCCDCEDGCCDSCDCCDCGCDS